MEKHTTILIADDNPDIREVLGVLLKSEGYDVIEAVDGNDAVEKARLSPDLIILDVMMPGKDGFKACVDIRKISFAPILFLTAKTEDTDKTIGFSSGGDDYLVKPFSYSEILARVKALLRRCYVYRTDAAERDEIINTGSLCVNIDKKSVEVDGSPVSLTDMEYNILKLLIQNRKKVFSAEDIYEKVWGKEYFISDNNTVMVHIRRLRTKIEDDPQNPKYIKTVWGRGYMID
ncbi:MAG: response regulator transcription factor [Firmicutes bacterium]|nr:response regulator transcription factor [Bacillota bacterium]